MLRFAGIHLAPQSERISLGRRRPDRCRPRQFPIAFSSFALHLCFILCGFPQRSFIQYSFDVKSFIQTGLNLSIFNGSLKTGLVDKLPVSKQESKETHEEINEK